MTSLQADEATITLAGVALALVIGFSVGFGGSLLAGRVDSLFVADQRAIPAAAIHRPAGPRSAEPAPSSLSPRRAFVLLYSALSAKLAP